MTLFRRPLALFRWFVTSGPKRLRAARLRRAGFAAEALSLFVDQVFFCELIRTFPDRARRALVMEYLCRRISAGYLNSDRWEL